jgi:archaemetzincin
MSSNSILCFCLLMLAITTNTKATLFDEPKIVYIQPLGSVEKADITLVSSAIERFYHYKCVIKPQLGFTKDILADSKTRYEANRILSKYNTDDNLLILTQKDIACVNADRHVAEWGIFGLGYRPGTTCVISTFRLKRNASARLFNSRLTKVCLHEIGHNLGLKHCSSDDKRCLMNDANGTIKEVDREQVFLCEKCRKVIGI